MDLRPPCGPTPAHATPMCLRLWISCILLVPPVNPVEKILAVGGWPVSNNPPVFIMISLLSTVTVTSLQWHCSRHMPGASDCHVRKARCSRATSMISIKRWARIQVKSGEHKWSWVERIQELSATTGLLPVRETRQSVWPTSAGVGVDVRGGT
jgi:hypothetical protein